MDYLKDFKKEIKENEDYEKRQSELEQQKETSNRMTRLETTQTLPQNSEEKETKK